MHNDFKPESGNTIVKGHAVIVQYCFGAVLRFFHESREVTEDVYRKSIETYPIRISAALAIYAENGNIRLWTELKGNGASMDATLDTLPFNHPLRNKPLHSIGAETKWKEGKVWKRVEPHWRIAKCTFNELGCAWTEFWLWKATL